MNINDRIKVTLTDKGLEAYKDFYRKTKVKYRNQPYWDKDIERAEKELKTSLWNFMEIFGPYTHIGMPLLFVDNKIEIVE